MENFNFDDVYQAVLEARQEKDREFRKTYVVELNTISPSSLGFCKRKQVMDSMNLGKEPDFELLRIFDYGNLLHDEFAFKIIQEYFQEVLHIKNTVVINEFPFKNYIDVDGDKVKIKGFIDDLIMETDDDTTKLTPIEIKSIGNAFFKLKEPKAEHQVQLHMYLRELRAEFGYIVYIHKGTLKTKTFRIDWDIDIQIKLEERIKDIYRYKKKGSIPPAEALINQDDYWFKGACDYCNHLSFCLEVDQGEIKSE